MKCVNLTIDEDEGPLISLLNYTLKYNMENNI